MSAPLSQKEYLRKYLSGAPATTKKKKKKKPKPVGQGMKIIDDDVDVSKMRALENDEIDVFGDPEDAPLVVGIIDDRPEELRFTTKKWKIVNQNDGIDSMTTVEQVSKKNKVSKMDGESPNESDSDLSPPRINNSVDSDLSPERNPNMNNKKNMKQKNQNDSDLSPERPSKSENSKKVYLDSPPRKRKNEKKSSGKRKKESDSDLSPDRNTNNKSKKSNSDSDLSPVRDNSKKNNIRNDNKSKRFNDSPLKHRERGSDRKSRWDNDSCNYSSFDKNQENHNRQNEKYGRDSRRDYRESRNYNKDNSDSNIRDNHKKDEKKSQKTLDGKTAGLQDSRQLKDESEIIKRKEDEMFSKLSDEHSGRNAQTVKRDIRRGKRETEAEKQEKRERELRQQQLDAKYSRWGKGLKQVEEQEARLKDYVHEASKPLARYKDDQDLEEELRGKERIGDPMLEYMRKKEREKGGHERTESHPIYQGAYPINRFDIRPGHRWDGVDRSSGYEKSYFEAKNSKKAQEEEIYKWSTEDM